MVKADYKRDYYADLDLPNTADPETIKKRFRELAKQYHPDRNPGREVDVVPKFQAIQAAHEILGDQIQKLKYDQERAKLNRSRDVESPTFKKPPPPPRRTDSSYANGAFPQPNFRPQPQPRRDPSDSRYGPQDGSRSKPPSANTSSADKFAQFARAAPQQWDRAKFEDAKADALRGMNAMRGGQVPQTSPLRTRHPTAPKPPVTDPYSPDTDSSAGYPGPNRSTNQRRGFMSSGAGVDEPRSAFAHHHRSERPPSAAAFSHVDPKQRTRESLSPLRQTRSFQNTDYPPRPDLGSRTSSRYAQAGGEKASLDTGNVGRSASVRDLPFEKKWEDRERGPFGNHSPAETRAPRPRHRSHSPKGRSAGGEFAYASQSSSDEDEIAPPQERKKAPLRRPHTHAPSNSDGPGLTGYFPSTNYTRVVDDASTYEYPAPDAKGTPTRRPFANLTSPLDSHDASSNEPAFHTSSQEEVPRHKYGFPLTPAQGWPTWAIPSSVCPKTCCGRKIASDHNSPLVFATSPSRWPPRGSFSADKLTSSYGQEASSSSKEASKFHASEWHEHFDNHADVFHLPEGMARDRKSPAKNGRTTRGAPPRDVRRDTVPSTFDPSIAAGMRHVDAGQLNTKAAAFEAGKLAPDFVEQVNSTRRGSRSSIGDKAATTPAQSDIDAKNTYDDRPASDEMDVDSPTAPDTESSGTPDRAYNVTVEEEEASPTTEESNPSRRQHVHRHPPDSATQSNGFNLSDLKHSAPFAPSDTGLRDLNDLNDSLPHQARAAENLEALHHIPSSTLRELNLPLPPKMPYCPIESELNQTTWDRYGDSMTTYMYEWNKFNAAMIEHFRARQAAVTHGMYRNWVSAQGDGATAEAFEASGGSDRAGYATYMTWLDDDRKCRTWWDVAFEDHRVCMEGLGKVRKRVKDMNKRG